MPTADRLSVLHQTTCQLHDGLMRLAIVSRGSLTSGGITDDARRSVLALLHAHEALPAELNDCLDAFAAARETTAPVDLGDGRRATSYHAYVLTVAREVVFALQVVSAADFVGTADQIAAWVTPETMPQLRDAIRRALTCEPHLAGLGVDLRMEFLRARDLSGAATPATAPTLSGWCHDSNETRPEHLCYGPLAGTLAELTRWIVGKPDTHGRQLKARGRTGRIWIVQRTRTSYEVWFQDDGTFRTADQKRRADSNIPSPPSKSAHPSKPGRGRRAGRNGK
jgi:hypothetical protein